MTTMTRGRMSSSMPGPTVCSGTCSGRAPPTADGARVDYTDHGLRGCERRRVGWGRRAGPDRSRLRTGVERGERPGDLGGQLGPYQRPRRLAWMARLAWFLVTRWPRRASTAIRPSRQALSTVAWQW